MGPPGWAQLVKLTIGSVSAHRQLYGSRTQVNPPLCGGAVISVTLRVFCFTMAEISCIEAEVCRG